MRLGFASSPFLVFSRESVLPVYRTLLSRPSSKKSFKRGLVCPNHPLRGPFSVDENTPLKFVEIASSLKQFRASCLAGNKQNALEIVQMLLYKTRSMETPLVPGTPPLAHSSRLTLTLRMAFVLRPCSDGARISG